MKTLSDIIEYKKEEVNIKKSFVKNKRKFDIIIDDSTHIFEHQINVIRNVHPFIKNKGICPCSMRCVMVLMTLRGCLYEKDRTGTGNG